MRNNPPRVTQPSKGSRISKSKPYAYSKKLEKGSFADQSIFMTDSFTEIAKFFHTWKKEGNPEINT